MTAIALLEKLGADASFEPSLLSKQDRDELELVIQKANSYNSIQFIQVPDEEDDDSKEDEDSEKETKQDK